MASNGPLDYPISKIAIVDGMVVVLKMMKNKKVTFSTVKNLAQSFNDRLTTLIAEFSEVILVFDTYKPDMLASGITRCNRGLEFKDNNHEEADTLMVCLAAKSLQMCPNAELVFRCFNSSHSAL